MNRGRFSRRRQKRLGVCDGHFQPNRFADMHTALAPEGGRRAVGLDIAVQRHPANGQ